MRVVMHFSIKIDLEHFRCVMLRVSVEAIFFNRIPTNVVASSSWHVVLTILTHKWKKNPIQYLPAYVPRPIGQSSTAGTGSCRSWSDSRVSFRPCSTDRRPLPVRCSCSSNTPFVACSLRCTWRCICSRFRCTTCTNRTIRCCSCADSSCARADASFPRPRTDRLQTPAAVSPDSDERKLD